MVILHDAINFKRSLAAELYRERKLSLGKAAELAGAENKWEMLLLLNEKGVSIDYTAENAEKDLKTLKDTLRNDRCIKFDPIDRSF